MGWEGGVGGWGLAGQEGCRHPARPPPAARKRRGTPLDPTWTLGACPTWLGVKGWQDGLDLGGDGAGLVVAGGGGGGQHQPARLAPAARQRCTPALDPTWTLGA